MNSLRNVRRVKVSVEVGFSSRQFDNQCKRHDDEAADFDCDETRVNAFWCPGSHTLPKTVTLGCCSLSFVLLLLLLLLNGYIILKE